MQHFRALGAVLLIGSFAVILLVTGPSPAQITKGKSRPLQTKHLMRGLTKVHCGALKKGLDAGPSSAEQWEELMVHAALLNELSFILMEDGRCPDGTWANAATKMLRPGSADVIAAIEAKNLGDANKAFASMTKACGTCHKAHKDKKKADL